MRHRNRSVTVRPCRSRVALTGSSMVEMLIALPLLCLIGLLLLQTALLFHAHQALGYALFEAARSASVQRGLQSAAARGLARGLMPFLSADFERALDHVRSGQSQGWIEMRRLSPTAASFSDWGRPERDDNGRLLGGGEVISSDNLIHRRRSEQPRSGVAAMSGAEPIGALSGQTLSDATLLKLELRFGVPVVVPLVGRFMVWTMRQYDGCGAPAPYWLAALRLPVEAGTSASPGPGAQSSWRCAFYDGRDLTGMARPRWPVRMSATIRMQSPIGLTE